MTLPIILLLKNQKKTWCQGYCPRASLYTTCCKMKKWSSLNTPRFFVKGSMKWIMLAYFATSLAIILMSTLKVAKGAIPPMNYLRFLIVAPVPFKIPQLFTITFMPSWLTHLSYRLYSMMMTTTILGMIMGMVYKPRTWCTVCPIATVSDIILKK